MLTNVSDALRFGDFCADSALPLAHARGTKAMLVKGRESACVTFDL
jgi:hypothetical protein